MGPSKLKWFYRATRTVSKMKRKPTDWEKIFANDAIGKVLISKIHKFILNKQTKKIHQKMGRRSKQTFLQRRQSDGQQAHRKMLNNITNYLCFPGGASCKESPCQCWRPNGSVPELRRVPKGGHGNSTPVFLPGESHGQRILVDYGPELSKESDMTEVTAHITNY